MMKSTDENFEPTADPIESTTTRHSGSYVSTASGERWMKVFLFVWNILIFIFSAVLLAYGSYALTSNLSGGAGLVTSNTLPKGIIALGVFLLFTSFLGICVTYKESSSGLAVYFIILFLMCILLFGVGGAVLEKKKDARSVISDGWNFSDLETRRQIEKIESCCGLNSFNDSSAALPCPPQSLIPTPPIGCLNPMVSTFESKFYAAGSVAIAFGVIMLVGLVVIIFLMQRIKQKGISREGRSFSSSSSSTAADTKKSKIKHQRLEENQNLNSNNNDDEDVI